MPQHHIEQEHPDYSARARMWRRYRHLYAGGETFREHAADYLVRRQREGLEVYQERLSRVFYENYLGSIVDWYTATLMRREPVIEINGVNPAGKAFFAAFADNCDLRGTSLAQFFRQQMTETLVCGKSYIAVDFPKSSDAMLSRAEEDAAGQSRAYLVGYNAEELINWSHNAQGELDWVVLRTSWLKQDSVRALGWQKETRWIYYDREKYEIFERRQGARPEENIIVPIDEGQHGFAGIHKVPVFELRVSDGLWLTNKVALLQLEHFNKSNALGWALTMGLFAMPVVYSDREWNQITGESYYIQLGPEDKFGWTEPSGHVFQIAADNLSRLKDEIYRVSYLLQQAEDGTPTPKSAESRQWDFSVTQEILRAYGATVKNLMNTLMNDIAEVRQDGLTLQVTGLDEFDITTFASEAADAQALLNLNIPSPTLTKQIQTRVALKYLSDSRQELKNQIRDEIEAAG